MTEPKDRYVPDLTDEEHDQQADRNYSPVMCPVRQEHSGTMLSAVYYRPEMAITAGMSADRM